MGMNDKLTSGCLGSIGSLTRRDVQINTILWKRIHIGRAVFKVLCSVCEYAMEKREEVYD